MSPSGPTSTISIGSANPSSGVSAVVLPADINDQADGVTPFARTYEVGTGVILQAPSKAYGHPFEKWLRDGIDYPGGQTAALAMDTNYMMTASYRGIAGLEIESKTVPAGSVPIHLKVSNDVPIRKIVLPLEIREVRAGATVSKLRVTYAERLAGYLTGINTAMHYAIQNGTCKNGLSGGYRDVTSIITPDGDVTIAALPEGISIIRGKVADPALPPGTDMSGSIILTVLAGG